MAENEMNSNIVDGLKAIVNCCNMIITALSDNKADTTEPAADKEAKTMIKEAPKPEKTGGSEKPTTNPEENTEPEKTVTSEMPVTKSEKKTEPVITKEMVRGVLADKSRKGFRKQVKAILTKHNSKDITHLDPADYAAVMKEAEELDNAG